jgi:hypothetical protein
MHDRTPKGVEALKQADQSDVIGPGKELEDALAADQPIGVLFLRKSLYFAGLTGSRRKSI